MKTSNRVLLCWAAIAGTTVSAMGVVMAQPGKETKPGQPPFSNAVDQRNEMLQELKQIRQLLKEQNDLLRSMERK